MYKRQALDRAAAIYRALPAVPDLLRIDGYPDEEPAESLLTELKFVKNYLVIWKLGKSMSLLMSMR